MMTSSRKQPRTISLWKWFVRLQNPLMMWLLNSPLHFLISHWYLIISVTGRKTGHIYSTPVQYARRGQILAVITSREYRWWRNLIGGGNLTLVLRGHIVNGHATISLHPDDILNAFQKIYPSLRFEQREAYLDRSVVVTITIE